MKSAKILNSGFWKAKILNSATILNSGFWKAKIFQKSPKKKASLNILKSTLAETTLSSNLYALKVQGLDKVCVQTPALKVAEWPSYNNVRKVT